MARLRPDLGVLLPAKPYCEYQQQQSWVHGHYKDWVFITSRQVADRVLSMADVYYNCSGPFG